VPLSERHGKVWRLGLGLRIVTVGFTAVLSLIGALAATKNFLGNFNNYLLLILYLFIPWTAVNLVDYYIVRRGHYAIAEIFNPHGMYGRWGWRGILAYLGQRRNRRNSRKPRSGTNDVTLAA
jgi:purine-cytosine permease-like protein